MSSHGDAAGRCAAAMPQACRPARAFIQRNIRYPEVALKNKIEGRVYVTFTVETDGSITNIKVLRDIGGGCGQEAVRVVSIMPKWKPGTQRGKPVRVQFNLPIVFQHPTNRVK